jgi:UDPglucose 6-dehydrogenase
MGLANAELAKLAVNTYVTMKISFANMLAQLCERIPDGDVDAITAAIGHDARIGSRYLKGALGYGGPCFPRDNTALAALASRLNVPAPLPLATEAVNKLQLQRLVELVTANLPDRGTVGILGLAYKPQTDVIDASPGLELARDLLDRGVEVVTFDPLATAPARKLLGGQVRFAASPGACVRDVDLLVVATPDEEGTRFDLEDLHRDGEPLIILDCWRTLDPQWIGSRCIYVPLGTAAVKQQLRPAAREWHDERCASNKEPSTRTGIHGKR